MYPFHTKTTTTTAPPPHQPRTTASEMSSLNSVEAKLPPGFRFHPKDDELICDYLMKWVNGCPLQIPLLIRVDLNKCEPWDIPETARVGGKEWYFYNQRDKKYATGLRKNRATISGYWKATGKDRPVFRKGTLAGMRKTLVFYQGRAPKGRKTYWVMHEFRLEARVTEPDPVEEDWVLCRVFYKNRSESMADKQENMMSYEDNSSPSLPALMETHNTFGHINHQSNTNDQFHAQVPCFSNIFTSYQTSPSFSLVTHSNDPLLNLPSNKTMPSFSGILPYPNNNNSSSCDKKVIETVLKNLTKMESATHLINSSMKGFSNFGEGDSENYLSEIGMTSFMWNC